MKLITLLLFIEFLCITSAARDAEEDDLIISTNNGKVRGRILPTPAKKMYAFSGIPYAVPPLGDLKFQATKPVGNWTGVLDATKEGTNCIGMNYAQKSKVQGEDCLFLNVYTPNVKGEKKLPVITYIHGGRYITGSGDIESYGPGFLVDHEVIVATFNYRLGPYGFLATEDMVVPGNAGLKDQLLALKWIKDNIKHFGGDPERITLMGQSAGGSSCALHLMSKKSKGLFRAAICISGSALTPWSLYNSPRNYTYTMANLLNKTITKETDVREVVDFLKTQSPTSIMKVAKAILDYPDLTPLEKEDTRLTPCLEPNHPDAFLTEKPYQLLKTGDFNQVPMLAGITSEESLLFVGDLFNLTTEASLLDNEPGYIFPYNFTPKANANLTEIEEDLKGIYLEKNEKFSDNLEKVIKFRSDDMFNRGTIKHALMQSKFCDVYFFEFSYWGNLNGWRRTDLPGMIHKCEHGDDQRYIYSKGTNYTETDEDLRIIKRMTTMVTNFVKYLNPTPTKSDLLQNLTWPKVKPNHFQYVNISDTLEIASDCKNKTFPMWSNAYYKWAKEPLRSF